MATAKVTVTMNPGWERALMDQLAQSPQWAAIQKQANEHAQAVLRQVNEEMTGGDVDSIHAELVQRLSGPGMKPNVAKLREYAESIADGTAR